MKCVTSLPQTECSIKRANYIVGMNNFKLVSMQL